MKLRSPSMIQSLLIGCLWLASATPLQAVESTSPIDLELYAALLDKHTVAVPEDASGTKAAPERDIAGTRVDYSALKNSADWGRLTAQVREARPSTLPPTDRKAFWINAYNILTIDLVVNHYPVASIKDIGSFFSPVWDKKVATIEGKSTSLNRIEHEILRKLGDPRIHAAIVCASTSCPSLARTPFNPEQLSVDLDRAMRIWVSNRDKGIAINRSGNQVRLSKIFDWFSLDFESAGGRLAFVADFASEEDADWLRTTGRKARITYFDYDWTLNSTR